MVKKKNNLLNKNKNPLILAGVILLTIVMGFFLIVEKFNTIDKDSNPKRTEDEKVDFQENTLPALFPSDFPIYPNVKIVSSWSNYGADNLGMSVIWISDDTTEQVYSYYEDELTKHGWSITNKLPSQNSNTISFTKGDKINGFIGISEDEKTTISVTIGIDK